jgi:hypothetical protein
MKKQIFSFLLFLLLFSSVSAQDKEAVKSDEYGDINCEEMMARVDNLLVNLQQKPDTKLYIIFYEGKHLRNIYDKKSDKIGTKVVNPIRKEAERRVDDVISYVTKRRNYNEKNRLIVTDGGFRENFIIEFWIVPNGTDIPPLTPTLTENDFKFRKSKQKKSEVEHCWEWY